MKVILDANVVVSAAIHNGASHLIVQSWLAGTAGIEVVMCPTLLTEIRDVLTTRPRLRKWITLDLAQQFVEAIEALVDLVDDPDPDVVEVETRDADDDYLIALARTHNVDLIVTGDKDLLEWDSQQPSRVHPADAHVRQRPSTTGNREIPAVYVR